MAEHFRYFIQDHKEDLERRIEFDKIKQRLEECDLLPLSIIEDICSKKLNFFELLSEMRYDDIGKFIKYVLKEVGYVIEAEWLASSIGVTCNERLYYKMNSNPLGYCMIINNVDFTIESVAYFAKRAASDKDAQDLSEMFSKIGYKVFSHRNLSAGEMKSELEKFSQLPDLASVDSCVICILTHGQHFGKKDVLYGADCNFIEKDFIYDIFSSEKCQSLRKKPKMFFFQACRIHIFNTHAKAGVLSYIDENGTAKFLADGKDVSAQGLSITMPRVVKNVELLIFRESEKKEPKLSDFIIVHSTLPKKASDEFPDISSAFCQQLVKIFSMEYRKLDLDSMLVLVNRGMMNQLQNVCSENLIHVEKLACFGLVHFYKMRTKGANSQKSIPNL